MQEVWDLLINHIAPFWERGWLIDPGSLLPCVSPGDAIQYLHSTTESILFLFWHMGLENYLSRVSKFNKSQ